MLNVKLFVYQCINGVVVAFSGWGWLRLCFSVKSQREARQIKGQMRDGITITASIGRFYAGGVWLTYGDFYYDGSNYAVVYSLFVHPVFRKLGVGSLLLNNCLLSAKEYGFHEVFLVCQSDNWQALRLYNKLGFAMSCSSVFNIQYKNELECIRSVEMVGMFKPC